VAAAIELQLREQGLGDARGVHTDTGPVRVVRADGPASGIRVTPLADATDRAVFGGQEVEQTVVDESWSAALESVGLARAASGRLRRLFSRFRIRSKRDWAQVDISGAKAAKPAKPEKRAKPGSGEAVAPATG
jgi:hypothetical protein